MSRLVLGFGASDRGDDAAGLEAVRRVGRADLKLLAPSAAGVVTLWAQDDDVVIVDAMEAGLAPGTVRMFDGAKTELPQGAFVTTHGMGPAEAVGLARALGRLPRSLRVYGIQVGTTARGDPMTPEVLRAVARVVEEIDHA